MIHIRYLGLADYFGDAWNWLNLLHLVVYLVYFIVRIILFKDKDVIPTGNMKVED